MSEPGDKKPPADADVNRGWVTLVAIAIVAFLAWVSLRDRPAAGPPIAPVEAVEPYRPPPPSLDVPGTEVSVHFESCTRASGYTTITGSVRNDGETTVRFVTVELRYLDAAGDVVDTGTTYAVGSEYLRPGEASQFTGSSRARGIATCHASLQEAQVVRQ